MTEATTSDAFLSGQGIPVELAEIESAMADLWGPAAERQGGPDTENPAVTRVSLANLVVVDLGEKPGADDGVIDTVVARHPCRAIVVRRAESRGRSVAAEISAACHLPAPGMPQVCSEKIYLRAGSEGFDLIPGAVRPLLEADLPMILCWVGDPRKAIDLFHELVGQADRAVMDLPDPCDDLESVRQALDLRVNPFGRDLSWFGITRWREWSAQFFDAIGQEEALRHLRSVAIVARASRSGVPPRVSAWLAGWLAGQLGWKGKTVAQVAPGRRIATFSAPSGEVTVTMTTEGHDDATPAHLASVSLSAKGDDGRDTEFHVIRSGDQVAVEVDAPGQKPLPRSVRSPEFTLADRISAALESARDDPPYRSALPHVLWLLGDGAATA